MLSSKANDEYALCKDEIRRDLITATAGVSALASFLMVGASPGHF